MILSKLLNLNSSKKNYTKIQYLRVRSGKRWQSSWFIKATYMIEVSRGSITGWKQAYEQNGIDGLRLNHKII